jgi:tetratricopeptide (TPR) repeat protein
LETQTKTSIGITVLGILSIGCGVAIIYRFLTFGDLNLSFLSFWGGKLVDVIFVFGLAAGFIVSGFGLIQNKSWSRHSILIITGMTFWGLLNRLILLGPFTEEYFYLISFSLVAFAFWFLNRKPIRLSFPYSRGFRIAALLWATTLTLEIISAVTFWFWLEGYKLPRLQRVVYESKNESIETSSYFRSTLPVRYSLVLPKGFALANLSGSKGVDLISLVSPQRTSVVMSDSKRFGLFSKGVSSYWKLLDYSDPYSYAKKYFSERYGLIFVLLRSLNSYKVTYQVEQIRINDLNIFIEKSRNKWRWMIQYYIFSNYEAIGEVIFSGTKEPDDFINEQGDKILSSIKLQDQPIKSDKEYFEGGLMLFNEGYFEEAKFSFASALYLNWSDPRYHFYLGQAFLNTEGLNSAKVHLKHAIKLQPDYSDAQKILNEIEEAERGKT